MLPRTLIRRGYKGIQRTCLQEVLQVTTLTQLGHNDDLILILRDSMQQLSMQLCIVKTTCTAATLPGSKALQLRGRLHTSKARTSLTASGRDCTVLRVSTCERSAPGVRRMAK